MESSRAHMCGSLSAKCMRKMAKSLKFRTPAELFVPDGVKAAAVTESSTPFDQRVFDVLNLKVASEPFVEDAVDVLVLETAAVTAHRNPV